MTADSLVRARSLAPTPTPPTTTTTSDTALKGLAHLVPPHKAHDPTIPKATEPAAGHDDARSANTIEPQTRVL
eukprot:scaffold12461_cov142-Isochrysis_galbana.AAC.3